MNMIRKMLTRHVVNSSLHIMKYNISISSKTKSIHMLSSQCLYHNMSLSVTTPSRSPVPYLWHTTTRGLKIDHKNMSPVDVEKELFRMKRQMGAYYSKAAYGEALKVAKDLQREVLDIMGAKNAVNASCLNDIGVMYKMLGNKDSALEKYQQALDIYEEVVGKSHMSYVNTSANIGVLYKAMADSAQSAGEYFKYLDLAEDILKKSLAARTEVQGAKAKDVLVNQNHLANILRCRGKIEEAEELYNSVLQICRKEKSIGNWDAVTALTLNNLGLLLKQCESHRWPEAEKCYKEAVTIRMETLGESHQDTIVSMHNLAEFYIARGDDDDQAAANELQQKILNIMGEDFKSDQWSDDAIYDSLPPETKHGEVVDKVEREQDQIEESKRKAHEEKMARLEEMKKKRAKNDKTSSERPPPAGELGGYYSGESTLPPSRSPVTAFLRKEQSKGNHDGEEDITKDDDEVLRKIYDSLIKKHSKK